jgi:hypothetical protein
MSVEAEEVIFEPKKGFKISVTIKSEETGKEYTKSGWVRYMQHISRTSTGIAESVMSDMNGDIGDRDSCRRLCCGCKCRGTYYTIYDNRWFCDFCLNQYKQLRTGAKREIDDA